MAAKVEEGVLCYRERSRGPLTESTQIGSTFPKLIAAFEPLTSHHTPLPGHGGPGRTAAHGHACLAGALPGRWRGRGTRRRTGCCGGATPAATGWEAATSPATSAIGADRDALASSLAMASPGIRHTLPTRYDPRSCERSWTKRASVAEGWRRRCMTEQTAGPMSSASGDGLSGSDFTAEFNRSWTGLGHTGGAL